MIKHRFTASLVLVTLFCVSDPVLADGIEISGTAEMGLVGGSGREDAARAQLLSDLDLQISMSRTTDSGLTFGVELDLDNLDLGDPSQDRQFPRRR